jgi:hypothetical protein
VTTDPDVYERAKERNLGQEPDELHLVYEAELARLRAENDRLRAEAAKAGIGVDADDPLGHLDQSILDEQPETTEEAQRRQHVAEFVLVALDKGETNADREQAIRHILVCDPARALGILISMTTNTLAKLEELYGDRPGTAVVTLRELEPELRRLEQALNEGTPN